MKSNDKTTPDDAPELFRAFGEVSGRYAAEYPRYWSPYKTAEEKVGYQNRLPTEIQPFVREYFRKHMGELLSHQSESTGEYLDNTKLAWSKHLEANRQADCFLTYQMKNVFGDWSPEEWRLAKGLLTACMVTDHIKVMYSGGIKRKLDFEVARLAERYDSVDPELSSLLMVPSFTTFYLSWELDHRRYLLRTKVGDFSGVLKKELIEKYHSGDERVFARRISDVEKRNSGKSPEELALEIDRIESSCRERAIGKMYAILERRDVQDFENLLRFDNTTEYEYTYSLKGLPDLFLREEILRRLVEKGRIDPSRSVFSLTYDEFIGAIDAQIEHEDRSFTIRLRHYQQNFDTCGTACIMSILNRKGLQLDMDMELRVWEMVGKPYNFPGGLAEVLLRNGFKVTYVQDRPELLSRDNPEFNLMSEELLSAAKNYVSLFESAVDRGLRFEVEDWGFERVKSEVLRGNPCLVYLHVSETVTHVVLAHGVKNGRLVIMDPLRSIKRMSESEFNKLIVNPMGKRLLVVHKLPRDLFDVLGEGLSAIGY